MPKALKIKNKIGLIIKNEMILVLYQSGEFPRKLLNIVLTTSLIKVYIIQT